MLVVCRWCANRRLHYAGLRFVTQQEYLFPHYFGTFPISSFPFHFVLSENNLKVILTQLPEKWWTLVLCSRNTSLTLRCPRIQSWDYTTHGTQTNITAGRGRKTYTCTTENPELGILQTGKQSAKHVWNYIWLKNVPSIFICWKYRHTPRSYGQTGLMVTDCTSMVKKKKSVDYLCPVQQMLNENISNSDCNGSSSTTFNRRHKGRP